METVEFNLNLSFSSLKIENFLAKICSVCVEPEEANASYRDEVRIFMGWMEEMQNI